MKTKEKLVSTQVDRLIESTDKARKRMYFDSNDVPTSDLKMSFYIGSRGSGKRYYMEKIIKELKRRERNGIISGKV